MLRPRVVPILLMQQGSLVKTIKFQNHQYIGDPCNTVRIFNELEVDELLLLDISVSKNIQHNIDFATLKAIASECFMPIGYGGGIRTISDASRILSIGYEKIAINTALFDDLDLVFSLTKNFGSQAIMASIDLKYDFWGQLNVYCHSSNKFITNDVNGFIKTVESSGVGELLITFVEKEGTWSGLERKLIREIKNMTSLPIILHGGANSCNDVVDAIEETGVSAVGLGSLVFFQKKGFGVLINMPKKLSEHFVSNEHYL